MASWRCAPSPPVGRNGRSRAPKPYGFLKTYGRRMRLVTRYDTGVKLRTALALGNPVPNVLDELTHVLGHVEVLTRYHTNSEL